MHTSQFRHTLIVLLWINNHYGCFLDPPVVVSPPHFYQGNKSLVEAVHGLHPTKSADETYVDIEPVSKAINKRRRISLYEFLFRVFLNLLLKIILTRSGFAYLSSVIGFKTQALPKPKLTVIRSHSLFPLHWLR